MKKVIAFFDFDGTITTKDTLLEFIRFSKGNFRFWLGFILNSPYLIAYKLKIISNQTAKEKVLRFFFNGTPVEVFEENCSAFTKKILPGLIRPKALEEIRQLQQNGSIVVVVSASPENWIGHWAKEMHVELIGSQLEIQEGKLTGRIVGKNCHGLEKVRRIQAIYNLTEYDEVVAYGDTSGDRPMLQLASAGHYKPFRK